MKNKSSPGDHNVLSLSSNTDDTNHKDQWRLLLKDAEYSSYSVVALSPCHKMVAFGNLRGKIKLQDASELEPMWLLIETKIVLTVKQQWQLCFLPSCRGRILLLFDNDFLAEIFLQRIHIP